MQQNLKKKYPLYFEFLTPKQKKIKDKIMAKNEELYDPELDAVVLKEVPEDYNADFSQHVYFPQSHINLTVTPFSFYPSQNFIEYVTSDTIQQPKDLLEITKFFNTQVKSYQVFVDSKEASNALIELTEDRPLNVEVIYKKKHWLERTYHSLKDISHTIKNSLEKAASLMWLAVPLYSSITLIKPFLFPALQMFNYTQPMKCVPTIDTTLITKGFGYFDYAFQRIKKLVAYLPSSKEGLLLTIGLYFGGGVIWSMVRVAILVMCPFLTPLFWAFGL